MFSEFIERKLSFDLKVLRNLNRTVRYFVAEAPFRSIVGYKIVPQKANYEVGANIQVLCDSGLKLQ